MQNGPPGRSVPTEFACLFVGTGVLDGPKNKRLLQIKHPIEKRWGVFIGKLEFDREFIQNHCNIVNYLFTLQFKISSIFFFKKLIADTNVSIASPLCLSTGCEPSYSIKSFLTLFLSCSTPMLQS